jgi:hypothetical protein
MSQTKEVTIFSVLGSNLFFKIQNLHEYKQKKFSQLLAN